MNDEDEAWWDSEECEEIKKCGEYYYWESKKDNEHQPAAKNHCVWLEGTKEYDAWHDGFRKWGN